MYRTEAYTAPGAFSCEVYSDHDVWLANRGKGIGGSDAAAMVDSSRFKSLQDLWAEKMLGRKSFVGGPNVTYGTKAEDALRTLFQCRHDPECGATDPLEVHYIPDACLISKADPWRRYSPDGLLYDPDSGKYGILEIKTSQANNSSKLKEWEHGVPIEYYLQILHGLLVTGFDFVVLTAEIRDWTGDIRIIERKYDRSAVLQDLEALEQEERRNWEKYFVKKQMPGIGFEL